MSARESVTARAQQQMGPEQTHREAFEAWPSPLADEALHGPAGEFVRLVEPHTEADRVALLSQFLVGFGNIAGRSAYYKVEADTHHLNLFMGLVGATAKGRKGTSWGHAKSILCSLDDEWRRRIVSGLSSGEGLTWAVRDPIFKQEPIREKRVVVGYQEVQVDPGEDDKRLLVLESELATTLRVLAREGNTLSGVVRQAWDSGALQGLVKNNPTRATDAHVSIIGHITRDELRRYLDRTEVANGFANRFLWLCTRRAQILPEGGRIDTVDFAPLLSTLRRAVSFVDEPRRFDKDSEAQEIWAGIYEELSEGSPGLFGAVTGRAEAQAVRLATLYAVLDCSPKIRKPHMLAALALWEYAEESARYIFGGAVGDTVADELLELLRRQPGVNRTDIRDHFGRNKRGDQITRALSVLEQAGVAQKEIQETGGRPAELWFPV